MQSRAGVYIVVPAYNEAPAIHDVVRDLRSEFANVVVVDDGSDDATAENARGAGAIVLQHIVNRGQGAALQTGIDYSVQHGAEVVVTFDADGQHRVGDVDRLLVFVRPGAQFLSAASVAARIPAAAGGRRERPRRRRRDRGSPRSSDQADAAGRVCELTSGTAPLSSHSREPRARVSGTELVLQGPAAGARIGRA